MKQIVLSLNERMQRPIVYLDNWNRIDAMIDTGAMFPVWVRNEKILERLGGEKVISGISFGGFGGETSGNLYKIPYFQLGDLVYPGLHIISCELNMPCHMILSATMFSRLRYEIDDENHKLNITVPDNQSLIRNLVIKSEQGRLKVFCMSGE